MYGTIKIRDFRQFKDKEVHLGRRLTVLAGRNSTGKSTILGLLANSGELKKREGVTLSNRQFRAEFGEILHGSKRYDDSGSDRLQIIIVDDADKEVDVRKFRTAWQKDKGKDRFRVIPLGVTEQGKRTEAKLQIPVLYLGLSRLFPIGEAEEDSIEATSIKFDSEEQKIWFLDQYGSILSLYDTIENVDTYSIGETSKKVGVGFETEKYDYLTNSAGQDNLGQILLELLSFQRLKQSRATWNGGLLLIDEVDATLHPAAQKKLIDLLIKEAKTYQFQVVVTTHSTDLLRHICTKTQKNVAQTNDIELYYFTNANRKLELKRNPSYSTIENDLLVLSMVQSINKVKVYSEDEENRWFLKNILSEYLPYIELLDVKIGCSQLISLYNADLSYFGNSLIVFDGDVDEKALSVIPEKIRHRLNNIITLPGEVRPEEVLYKYIMGLTEDHPYWEIAGKFDLSWIYFRENGPESDKYKGEKEREKYKAWFVEHEKMFDSTNLFDFWKSDNQVEVDDFIGRFKSSYNSIAARTFAKRIEN
jgi:hypothetical protein